LPFFYDFDKKTILHHSVENENFNAITLILSNIKSYSVDHHDRMIADIYPDLIATELEIIGPYMDARIRPLKYMKTKLLARGVLKSESEDSKVVLRQLPILSNIYDLKELIYEAETGLEGQLLDIDLKIASFSTIYNNEETGLKVMEALASTSDLSLFNRKSVRLLIDHKWKQVRSLVIKKLMIPYLNYLLCYFIWGQYIYSYHDNSMRDHPVNIYVSLRTPTPHRHRRTSHRSCGPLRVNASRGYGSSFAVTHAWDYGVGFDTLYLFWPVWRHILGGPMRVSSHANGGAGSAHAPLLGLMALARSSFWDAPSTLRALEGVMSRL